MTVRRRTFPINRYYKPHLTPSPKQLADASSPHSAEAEHATLGSLLLDPERIIDVMPVLSPDDFYLPIHRVIYAAILRLYEEGKAIDVVTVCNELTHNDVFKRQMYGSSYVAELSQHVSIAANVGRYAEIVKDKSLHRKLGSIAGALAALASDESVPATEMIEKAEQQLLSLSRQSSESKPQHIAEVAAESYERYARLQESDDKASLHGLRTGFRNLDEMLTGLVPGQLVILAARPSMGKTALALDIARHVAAELQKNVAIFSLEMTKQELMDRVIAGLLGVETWKLKKGELTEADYARMGHLFDGLKRHPLYIDDDPDTTIANLRSKARRHQMEHGLDLLVIDYLQLIEVTDRASGENRTQQVSHISRSLKNLARELGCPILALSQLSRSVEQRTPAIPILSDLRDSGTIEQDADIVLMLYRESVYNEDCDDPGLTDLYVRKNRSGPPGRVELHFAKERMSFHG